MLNVQSRYNSDQIKFNNDIFKTNILEGKRINIDFPFLFSTFSQINHASEKSFKLLQHKFKNDTVIEIYWDYYFLSKLFVKFYISYTLVKLNYAKSPIVNKVIKYQIISVKILKFLLFTS